MKAGAFVAALLALWLAQAGTAHAQASCPLDSLSLNIFLTGGGAVVATPQRSLVVAPGSSVSLGVYCEFSGQFPPPVSVEARYAWTNGFAVQRIEVVAPAAGQRTTYGVRVTTPAGQRDFEAELIGAAAGAPICRIVSDVVQPVPIGTSFVLLAQCSGTPASYRWDVPGFLGTLALLAANAPAAQVTIIDGQPGAVFPIYLTVDGGQAPYASFLVTVGERGAVSATNAPGLALGGAHSCALTSAGGARCWGNDQQGQLGDFSGGILYSTTPVNGIGLSTGLRELASGAEHACALTAAGGVKCWGRNDVGQLGDGTLTRALRQVDVVALSNVAAIGSGPSSRHTCAVLRSGGVACWGFNGTGQLGNGNAVNQATPVTVQGLGAPVRMVSTGANHSCALTGGGAVQCWGHNANGQLGDGTTQPSLVPVAVRGLQSGVVAITSGFTHNCALLQSGAVRCWGGNGRGQLGAGTAAPQSLEPLEVAGLRGVVRIAAGSLHACALDGAGAVACWGDNAHGQVGDGTLTARNRPAAVRGLAADARGLALGAEHSCALLQGGGVLCWGNNGSGRLGDATLASRAIPQLVVGALGSGFLDATLEDGFQPPPDKVPVFGAVASGSFTDVTAQLSFRPQDVGRSANIYVFALAPADRVSGAAGEALPLAKATRGDGLEGEVPCVLAQLTASGQLRGVSASSMQAYVSGVLGAQGQAVDVIRGQAAANAAGATFFVGYGSSATDMLDSGVNRGVVTVPGPVRCQPQAPQTGWWWNPVEAGRGYSLEVNGRNMFFAAFHYDASGRSTWHVATGPTSLDGALFQGDLLRVEGGQTLEGPYRGFPRVAPDGRITLAFNEATRGTMIWPGGAVPIERFDIVPRGLAAAPRAGQPESGWWWNPDESGRGFFIEWQDGTADLAGYMYDEAGQPVWYLSVFPTPDIARFSGEWWSYAGGQAMGGPYKPATRVNDHVAAVTVEFTARDRAVMTLPGGRRINLVRHRF